MSRAQHGNAWCRVGWRVEQVDEYVGTVTFARDGAIPGD
jgi:hypothetical protein